jgi:hypothetical protein
LNSGLGTHMCWYGVRELPYLVHTYHISLVFLHGLTTAQARWVLTCSGCD